MEPRNPFLDELLALKLETHWYYFKLNDAPTGQRLLGTSPEEHRTFVLAAAEWLQQHPGLFEHESQWIVRVAMLTLLRRRLPLGHEDVLALLEWSRQQKQNYSRGLPQMLKVVEDFLKNNELTAAMREGLDDLVNIADSEHNNAETRKWVARLRELTGQAAVRIPLVEGEAWADAALADIASAAEPAAGAWLDLLNTCAKASGSAPSAKWLKSATASVEKIGRAGFREAVTKWFALVDRPPTQRVESWSEWQPDPNLLLNSVKADRSEEHTSELQSH